MDSTFGSDRADRGYGQLPDQKNLLEATNQTLPSSSTVVTGRGLAYYEVVSSYGRFDLQQPGHHRGTGRREIIGISSRCHSHGRDCALLCFLNASKTERKMYVS